MMRKFLATVTKYIKYINVIYAIIYAIKIYKSNQISIFKVKYTLNMAILYFL